MLKSVFKLRIKKISIWSVLILLIFCFTFDYDINHLETRKENYFVSDLNQSSNSPVKMNTPNIVISQIYEINDDEIGNSEGDGDNLVDSGETIELRLQLENTGNQTVTDVYANLTTTNPFVIIDSSNQSYLQIPVGETRLSTSYYLVEFNSIFNNSDTVSFSLEITANEGSWYDSFDLEIIGTPQPNFYGHIVYSELDGDLNANDDEIIDPGERIYFDLYVENSGNSTLFDVDGYLSTLDSYITILDNNGYFGTIYGNDEIEYGYFAIEVSGACPELHVAPFNLTLIDKYSNDWEVSFEIVISGLPDYQLLNVTFSEYYGDDDDILDAGETCVTEITIRNIGDAIGKNIDIHLGAYNSLVEFYYVEDHNVSLDELAAGFSTSLYSTTYWQFDIPNQAFESQILELFICITDTSGGEAITFNTTLQVIGVAEYELVAFEIIEYCYYEEDCGNTNRIDAGDTFIANISISNIGSAIGNDVTIYLYSSDKFVEFYYENGSYCECGSIDEDEIISYYGYYEWEFTISEKAKTGRVIEFTIVIVDASEREWLFKTTITVEDGPNTFFYTVEGILLLIGGSVFFMLFFVIPIVRSAVKSKKTGEGFTAKYNNWIKEHLEKQEKRKKQREKDRKQKQKEREAIKQDRERERITRINENERELLEKFENILEMSESVDISMVAKSLGLKEPQLFEKLIQWQDMLPFKIDGKYIEVDDTRDFSQSIQDKIAEISKHYTCYQCGFPIESNSKECPECKSAIVRCIVCKLPISFGDEIESCKYCEGKGHKTHLQEWVKVNGKCPVCQKKMVLDSSPSDNGKQKKKNK